MHIRNLHKISFKMVPKNWCGHNLWVELLFLRFDVCLIGMNFDLMGIIFMWPHSRMHSYMCFLSFLLSAVVFRCATMCELLGYGLSTSLRVCEVLPIWPSQYDMVYVVYIWSACLLLPFRIGLNCHCFVPCQTISDCLQKSLFCFLLGICQIGRILQITI